MCHGLGAARAMNRILTPSHASHADVAADGLRQLPPFVQISSWGHEGGPTFKNAEAETQRDREQTPRKKAETCELSPEFLTHICIFASFASFASFCIICIICIICLNSIRTPFCFFLYSFISPSRSRKLKVWPRNLCIRGIVFNPSTKLGRESQFLPTVGVSYCFSWKAFSHHSMAIGFLPSPSFLWSTTPWCRRIKPLQTAEAPGIVGT